MRLSMALYKTAGLWPLSRTSQAQGRMAHLIARYRIVISDLDQFVES